MREQMTIGNEITRLQSPWRDFKTFTSKTKQEESEGIQEGRKLEYLN
jgi:hypothetical protein